MYLRQKGRNRPLLSATIAAIGVFCGGIDAAGGRVVGASPIDPVKLPSQVRLTNEPAPSAEQTQVERHREKAHNINEAGNAALKRRDAAAAIERFTEALSYLPDDPVIEQNLTIAKGLLATDKGMAMESQGNLKAAVKEYKKAADDLPLDKTFQGNLNRANSLLRAKQERDARGKIKQEQPRHDRRPPTKMRSHFSNVLPA